MHNAHFHTTLPKTQVSRGDGTRWFGVSGPFIFARRGKCNYTQWLVSQGHVGLDRWYATKNPSSIRSNPGTVNGLVDLSRVKSTFAIKVDFVSSKRLKYVTLYITQYIR